MGPSYSQESTPSCELSRLRPVTGKRRWPPYRIATGASFLRCFGLYGGQQAQDRRNVDILKLHRKRFPDIIMLPLITVMAGENLTGLSDRDVEQRAVPVGQIGRHPHRRAEAPGQLLNRGGSAAHRNGSDVEILAHQWHRMYNWIGDRNLGVFAIIPSGDLGALHPLPLLHRAGETF